MADAKKKNSSVVTVRENKTIGLPVGPLGYSSLIEPDTYDPEKPTLKLNWHLSPEAITQMADLIREKVYTASNLAKLKEEAIANGFKASSWKDPQDPAEWLEGKLKDPRERDVVQLPYITVSNRATFKKREGGELVTVDRKLGCWDAKNNKLDLPKLRIARGSLISPVVNPNLFISKVIGFAQPSLKLVGIKVFKLERFGGGGSQSQEAETDEEAIRDVLGEGFQFEDLAAFAMGAHDDDEEEDEAAAPADEAARLFGSSD